MMSSVFSQAEIVEYEFEHLSCEYQVQFGANDEGVRKFVVTSTGSGNESSSAYECGYFYGAYTKKNIITISTMRNCPLRCQFCPLGKMQPQGSLSPAHMREQVILVLKRAIESGVDLQVVPHKISLTESGEPLLHPNLIDSLEVLSDFGYSFKVSSVLHDSALTRTNLRQLATFASQSSQPVQLQLSLLATDEDYRQELSGAKLINLREVSSLCSEWRACKATQDLRVPNLNFILTRDCLPDARVIADIFNPQEVRIRLRSYVATENGEANSLSTVLEGQFRSCAEEIRKKGFEVSIAGRPPEIARRFATSGNSELQHYYRRLEQA